MNWTAEAKLGFFIVVAILVTVALTLRFVHFHLTPKGSYRIYADFRSVDGLEKGTAVRIAGVRVGEVTDITLRSSGMAHVEMMIFDGLKLPADIHPVIFSNGFFGKALYRTGSREISEAYHQEKSFFSGSRQREKRVRKKFIFDMVVPFSGMGGSPSIPGGAFFAGFSIGGSGLCSARGNAGFTWRNCQCESSDQEIEPDC